MGLARRVCVSRSAPGKLGGGRWAGRGASERASEAARAGERAREGPAEAEGVGGEDGSALSKYKSRREASKPGAEPKSRRAVTRPYGRRRRRLLRGARLRGSSRVASSRGAARATLAAQRRRQRAGLEGAARPRERPEAAPGPCGTARRSTARHGDGREPPSPSARPSLARSRAQHGCGRRLRLRLPGRAE